MSALLVFHLFDEDIISTDDFLGKAVIHLKDVPGNGKPIELNLPLGRDREHPRGPEPEGTLTVFLAMEYADVGDQPDEEISALQRSMSERQALEHRVAKLEEALGNASFQQQESKQASAMYGPGGGTSSNSSSSGGMRDRSARNRPVAPATDSNAFASRVQVDLLGSSSHDATSGLMSSPAMSTLATAGGAAADYLDDEL